MPNAKREGRDVTMHLQHPDGFNPNNSIYKTCCCHVKTFTIVMGIFEIFIICFLLVAVLPDVTTRVCDMMTNETEILNPFDNFHIENVRNGSYVSSVLCHNNIACLVWAALQIFAVNVMFYGIKTINHWYFVPHFVFRITTLALLALVEAWLIYITAGEIEDLTPYYTTIAAFVIVIVAMLYATWVEIRCAHFVKRSRETGFSISVARPVGPATISLTDNPQTAEAQPRRLPPIRGTRNTDQYVVNELPKTGNPNEASP